MRLTEKQREIVESPLRGALFLRGPAGAGKTTVGVARLRHLIENGVPAHSILVLAPQKRLALPYLNEIRNPRRRAGSEATVATLGSLAFQMVNLFWPLAARGNLLSERDPYRRPVFLSLELVQYLMFKLLDPEIQRNDRFKSVRIGQTRLFSQIADNLNKSSLVGFDHSEIAARLNEALPGDAEREHIYNDAQVCANLFREYCVDHNLLDFSLQVRLFAKLWQQPVPRAFLQRRYAHIIADNLEEDTPVTHDLLRDWLPQCRSALLIQDEEAGYRRFLGADEVSASALEAACDARFALGESRVMKPPVQALLAEVCEVMTGEEAETTTRQRERAREAIEFTPAARSRFHTQMLDWVVESIGALVRDEGVPPGRIVILAPLLGDALRFSLVSRLDRLGVPSYTLRPSRPLHAEPAVRALVTLAKLAHPEWKLDPKERVKEFDVTQMLLGAVDELDLTRASLLAGVLFGAKEGCLFPYSGLTKNPELRARISEVFGERYDRLVGWLDEYRAGDRVPLDVFFGRLFGEVLSQKGFGFHRQFDEARIVANLIESARAFRHTLAEIEPEADIGFEYVRMVDAGILADQYEPQEWKRRPDAVLIAPAYTFLLSNQPVDYQFWLNLDSPAWTRRLFQPLTQPYVLSRQWPREQVWTEADEQRTSRDILQRVVTGLLRRCRRKIFLGYSKFDERGNEQIGELRMIFDLLLRSSQ